MADEIKKTSQEKDSSAGLGALVGFTAAAAIPFLRPFRNIGKVKRALDVTKAENAARTTANEQLMPKLLPAPKGITALKPQKVKYEIQRRPEKINPLVNDRDDILRKAANVAYDDREPQLMFGSALYDQIKMFPKQTAKADEWIKFLKTRQNVKYQDGRSASVDTEELFDTNMALFDKSGALTGGLLKTAKDMNMIVDKNLLLRQVRKNPFNELELKKFKTPSSIARNVGELETGIERVAKMLETKYLDETGAALAAPKIAQLRELIQNVKNQIGSDMNRNSINLAANTAEMKSALRNILAQVNDPQDVQLINRAIATVNGTVEDIAKTINNPGKVKLPVHATGQEYGTYRMVGEENPGEFVWKFKAQPPTVNYDGVLGRSHNFGKFPVVHAMYGTRFTPNGQKVVSINEIQADIQQKVFDHVKGGKVRVNPFGRETEKELLAANLQPQRDIIAKIMKKGIYATDDELFELNKAFNTLKSQSNVIRRGAANISEDAQTAYLPFYNNKNYTDLALKTIVKEAGDDGAQWVSVVPVEYMSRGNGAITGNQIAYGFANGKGHKKKGMAVIPELMKKLANQYKTEAKVIQVSKSDPKKPYKIVQKKEVDRFDGTGGSRGDKIETFTTEQHTRAFATENEAKSFARDYGGTVKYVPANDPDNYLNMFALRISPDMVNKPMKLYKSKGGLIENIFKPL